MYNKTLYHGTEINRGKSILKSQKMIASRGDKHWLGDGSYFYEDDFYAYKWIKDLYKARYKEVALTSDAIFFKYMILKSVISAHRDRVFDMDNPTIKIEFDIIYKRCMELKKHSKRFSRVDMADGVVLNIMFSDMGYSEDFDLVVATFVRRREKYHGIKVRLNHIFEKQICIKNVDTATQIKIYECNDKVDEFEFQIENLYKIVPFDMLNKKAETYNKRRIKYKVKN